MSATKLEGTARERLLAAATELFYEEGIHTVGIDRVIERAGVAKASLYSTFGSKDELVRAYLQGRAEARKRRISERIAPLPARARILAIFDLLGEQAVRTGYRGCAFVNASAEGPRDSSSPVTPVCTQSRAWMRELFVDLARDAGAADPEVLAGQLVLIYDGATVGAAMDHDPAVAARARALAETLLAQAISAAARPAAVEATPAHADPAAVTAAPSPSTPTVSRRQRAPTTQARPRSR